MEIKHIGFAVASILAIMAVFAVVLIISGRLVFMA